MSFSLLLLFFTKHDEKQVLKFCKVLAQRKGVRKAKLVSIYPDLDSEHIHVYVSVPPAQLPDAEKALNRLGRMVSRISDTEDVIVQVMGYPELVYRTQPSS